MGLSSKQVSRDGHGWSQALLQAQTTEQPPPKPSASMKRRLQQSQNQQQQGEPLKCPRCDSTNTKFCYYNNYNKSQPRHFCKTCKRHWTKGGTLRNVPVGGGRKNKRLKTSNTSTPPAAASKVISTHMPVQSQQQRQNLPFTLVDQKKLSDVLYQAMIPLPSNLEIKDVGTNNNIGSFISSSLALPQNQSLNIDYASTSSFSNTIPITSFQLSNVVNNNAAEAVEEPTNIISSTSMTMPITSSSVITQPWQVASTSSGMDNIITSYWNWDDIDTFASTDLNIPWDDSDTKP